MGMPIRIDHNKNWGTAFCWRLQAERLRFSTVGHVLEDCGIQKGAIKGSVTVCDGSQRFLQSPTMFVLFSIVWDLNCAYVAFDFAPMRVDALE